MLHRIVWFLRSMKLKKKNIFRHWLSYSDKASSMEGNNYLAQRAKLLNSSLGVFSYVNFDSVVSHTDVGRFTCVGPGSWVGGIGMHPTNRKSTHRMFYSSNNPAWSGYASSTFEEVKRTYVGNDVWIGARCTVLDGVNIGDGAIIAAGSVVTKDVEPYSIVGGVPAKLIRKRFSTSSVKYLLSEKWWEKSPEELKQMVHAGEFSGIYMGGIK